MRSIKTLYFQGIIQIMKILAIETSCDETSAAVVVGESIHAPIFVLSNVIISSLELHIKTGGVVPEVAAREQQIAIIPVIKEALAKANISPAELDAIAVAYGPGLVGSLLVGVETAKAMSLAWKKPLLAVNHLLGHVFSNWITKNNPPTFPALGMVVSGGHTDLVMFSSPTNYAWIGGTRDDAAGECFDKCARLILNAPYPGGPIISREARLVSNHPKPFLPRPMLHDGTLEMSFSGLKTAVLNLSKSPNYSSLNSKRLLAFDLERAIVDVLLKKITTALLLHNPMCLLVGGGVVANEVFREKLSILANEYNLPLFYPDLSLCGDNAAMIGAAAFMTHNHVNPLELVVNPGLAF